MRVRDGLVGQRLDKGRVLSIGVLNHFGFAVESGKLVGLTTLFRLDPVTQAELVASSRVIKLVLDPLVDGSVEFWPFGWLAWLGLLAQFVRIG